MTINTRNGAFGAHHIPFFVDFIRIVGHDSRTVVDVPAMGKLHINVTHFVAQYLSSNKSHKANFVKLCLFSIAYCLLYLYMSPQNSTENGKKVGRIVGMSAVGDGAVTGGK